MSEAAIVGCEKRLRWARRAFEQIDAGRDLDEVEEAWDSLLAQYYIIYEKLKAGAKGNPAAWEWYRGIVDLRATDPLLRYAHYARNQETHRLEVSRVPYDPAILIMGKPDVEALHLKIEVYRTFTRRYVREIRGKNVRIVDVPHDYRGTGFSLLPVTAKIVSKEYPKGQEVSIDVPRLHLGQPIQRPDVDCVSERLLVYLESLVAAARSRML